MNAPSYPRAAADRGDHAPRERTRTGSFARAWALLGVSLLLGEATIKLGARGLATARGGLEPGEWLALLVLTALFVYGEGVRALQRRWVPRILERSERVAGEKGWYGILAPLYAMSLVGAARATLLRSWSGVAAIITAVLIVRALPDPWRGIIDLSVAAALAWGLASLLLATLRRRRTERGAGSSGSGGDVVVL